MITMNMRPVLVLIGVIVAFLGLGWLMQGVGILSGSFMSGSQFWAMVGGLTFMIGVVIIAASFRIGK